MLRILLLLPFGGVLASAMFIALAQLSGLPKQNQPSPPDLAPIQLFKLSQSSELQIRQRSLPEAPQLIPASQPSYQQAPTSAHTRDTSPAKLATLSDLSLPKLDNAEFKRGLSLANAIINAPQPANNASGPSLNLSIQPQYRHPPEYPLAARRRNIEGSVTLEFNVQANGQVLASSIKVLEATPSGVFEQAAKRSLSQWRFPVDQKTAPFGFKSRQKIEFKLTHDQ